MPVDISVGKKFDRWTVVGPRVGRMVPCRCSCGVERLVAANTLRNGSSRSCGCRRDELPPPSLIHGQSSNPLYWVWRSMLRRCSVSEDGKYHLYGGRGITVCDEWNQFDAFHDWALANGYSQSLTLDRTDNDGNYEPANCRWVTRAENIRNRRITRRATAWGETKPIGAWAEDSRCVVSYDCLFHRIRRGVPPEKAITAPLSPRRPL